MSKLNLLQEFNYSRSDFQDLEFDSFQELDFKEITNITADTITFKICQFHKGLKIINFNHPKIGIQFLNCEFGNKIKGIELLDSQMNFLIFSGCNISAFNLAKNQISNSISIYRGKLNNVRFGQNKASYLDIEGLKEPLNQLLLNNSEIEKTHITNNAKIEKIIINEVKDLYCTGEFGNIELNSNLFESIEFSGYFKEDIETKKKIEIKSKIDSMSMQPDAIKGTLNLSGLTIKKLSFVKNICNSGTILLNNIQVDDFSIDDGILKNMYWNNIQFKNKLEIYNSEISSLKYSNIDWILKTKFSSIDLQFDKTFYSKKEKKEIIENIEMLRNDREVYRQLKVAAKGIDNQIDALEFYRLEMRLYWKEIRFLKSEKWQNRFLVFVNRWSSDFGQNWGLPLFWLSIFHFIFLMCLFNFQFSFELKNFGHGFGQFFYLLNPVHKTPEYINTDWGLFTEFLMRIFDGYFIYHIIRSTRKYGKV